jgi:hypothetical protein
MPRAPQPHTPDIDLDARRAYAAGGGAPEVLTPDLAAFCQSGVSVIVGACRPGEAPVAGLGCACRILSDGRRRLLLPRPGNERLLTMVEGGGAIAITFSQPITHRSIQVKGSRGVVAMLAEEDRLESVRQSQGIRQELVDVGYPSSFAEAYCRVDPDILVALDLTLDAAFVQTPGPGAGAELKP